MTDMREKLEQMDGQELLKLIEAAQAKLDELQVQQSSRSVSSSQEDEEGVAVMCKVLEDMRNEAARNAVEKACKTSALVMLADGLSVEKVAKYSQLSVDRVRELAAQMATQ